MKFILTLIFAFLTSIMVFAQDQKEAVATKPEHEAGAMDRTMPSVDLKNLDGKSVNTKTLTNDGKPMVISFWATWCKPCITELIAMADVYDTWQKETGVKVVAISIDDARNAPKVGPFVNGKGWDFSVLIDQNQDLKRALNVNTIPHVFLIDGKGKIVYQHAGYYPGSEVDLYKLIQKLAAGESIK
jgi:peroxiredoxin